MATGVPLVGLGAVATTFIVAVESMRRGLGKRTAALFTQIWARFGLGKREQPSSAADLEGLRAAC